MGFAFVRTFSWFQMGSSGGAYNDGSQPLRGLRGDLMCASVTTTYRLI